MLGRKEGQETRLLSNSTCLPGALGARGLFKGFKQEERSSQCSENAAFLSVLHHPGGGKTEMQEIHRGPGNVASKLWDAGALVARALKP